jgi:hypothetical protein
VNPKTASASLWQGAHLSSPTFGNHFHYHSVISKLNHLERESRRDIAYASYLVMNHFKRGRTLTSSETGFRKRACITPTRHGYIIAFLGCSIMWKSHLQTDVALSSCESEFIALREALYKVIQIMRLIQGMKGYICHGTIAIPTVHGTLFDDSSGALMLARSLQCGVAPNTLISSTITSVPMWEWELSTLGQYDLH